MAVAEQTYQINISWNATRELQDLEMFTDVCNGINLHPQLLAVAHNHPKVASYTQKRIGVLPCVRQLYCKLFRETTSSLLERVNKALLQ